MRPSRITLGTAQFGLDYGISNRSGKPSKNESLLILQTALQLGINSFDTASAYGNSEDILGEFIKHNSDNELFITTKLPSLRKANISNSCIDEFVSQNAKKSHKKLGKSISNYLVHDFTDYLKHKEKFRKISFELKGMGIIKRFGVSLYESQEAEHIIEDDYIDSVQIPLSILNQSFLKNNLLSKLKAKNKLIFARSIFTQGLIFLKKEEIEKKIPEASKWIKKILELATTFSISKLHLAIGFVLSVKEIDSVIIGVNNTRQLQNNIDNSKTLNVDITEQIKIEFSNVPKEVFDPRMWSV